jgi:DNA adenine methylase
VIAAWSHETSAPIRIEHGDAFAFLREHDFGADQLVYADPPYLPSARRRSKIYRHDLEEGDHARLLDLLASLPSHVIISGYPSELYDRMLVGWRRTEFAVGSQAGLRDEVVWHNFDPPTVLHDYGHLGNDYRERQRLKRKANRWRRRLEAMPEGERHALLSALGDLAAPPPAPSSAFAS